jgi:hypothetical protein
VSHKIPIEAKGAEPKNLAAEAERKSERGPITGPQLRSPSVRERVPGLGLLCGWKDKLLLGLGGFGQ